MPAFCVITARDGRALRLEYYEGQDTLRLRHDIRARELHGVDSPNFMAEGPQWDDPVKFL